MSNLISALGEILVRYGKLILAIYHAVFATEWLQESVFN